MAERETLLAETFLTLADTLVDDFDVIDVLSTLSGRCVELLEASATGILLADATGALHVVAATSEALNVLELFQIQNEQGPCLDCYRTGVPVIWRDLGEPNPWPRFTAKALQIGFHSVHAFPMAIRGTVLGTMNLFMRQPTPLGTADIAVAQALAHAATLTLLQYRAAEDHYLLTTQLQGALTSRITIEQAKGVISEVATIGTDEAFNRLRSLARQRNIRLTDLAGQVVNRRLSARDRDALDPKPADARLEGVDD